MQAGIALGLAQAVAARFPEWGPDFAGRPGSRCLCCLRVAPHKLLLPLLLPLLLLLCLPHALQVLLSALPPVQR